MSNDDDKKQIEESIRTSSWFSHLPETGRQWLMQRARLRSVEADEQLLIWGEPNESAFGLISGRLRGSIWTPMGSEVTVTDMGAGDWLGNYALATDQGAAMDVYALEPSCLVDLPIATLRQAGERWPTLYHGMFGDVVLRACRMLGLVELMGGHGLAGRIAMHLLVASRLYGRHQANSSSPLRIQITASELAQLCFGTTDNVQCILAAWAADGIIEVHADILTLLNMRCLIDKAGRVASSSSDHEHAESQASA